MQILKRVFRVSLISAFFLAFTAIQAQAIRWVYIGSSDEFAFYVDVDNEKVKGSLWASPIRVDSDSGHRFFGAVVIDCRDITYKMRLEDRDFDWAPIEKGSPLGEVVRRVCN